jgi:hypothetical protein
MTERTKVVIHNSLYLQNFKKNCKKGKFIIWVELWKWGERGLHYLILFLFTILGCFCFKMQKNVYIGKWLVKL